MTCKQVGLLALSALLFVWTARADVALPPGGSVTFPTEVGAFPNFRRPRVVWVGMTSERALQSLAGDIDRDEAVRRLVVRTRQYAKRQRVWMRRLPGLQAVQAPEQLLALAAA